MSNYVQSTNFATKDALSSGDPLKIVKGTEINTEFNNIATAIATKLDSTPIPTLASTVEAQEGTENTKFITSLRLREGFNASGTAPVFACRSFVNFNGTGTVAIRASGNVSSISDNGTGNYTVNFTTAMQDADYSVVSGQSDGLLTSRNMVELITLTTASVSILTKRTDTDVSQDTGTVCLSIFR